MPKDRLLKAWMFSVMRPKGINSNSLSTPPSELENTQDVPAERDQF